MTSTIPETTATTTQHLPHTPISKAAALGASEAAEEHNFWQYEQQEQHQNHDNDAEVDDDNASVLSMGSISSPNRKQQPSQQQSTKETSHPGSSLPEPKENKIVSIPDNLLTKQKELMQGSAGGNGDADDDNDEEEDQDKVVHDDDSLLDAVLSDEPLPVIVKKEQRPKRHIRAGGRSTVSSLAAAGSHDDDDDDDNATGITSVTGGFSVRTAPVQASEPVDGTTVWRTRMATVRDRRVNAMMQKQTFSQDHANQYIYDMNYHGSPASGVPSKFGFHSSQSPRRSDVRQGQRRHSTYNPHERRNYSTQPIVRRRATTLELKTGIPPFRNQHPGGKKPSTLDRRLSYQPPENVLPKKIHPKDLVNIRHMTVSPKAENPVVWDERALAAAKLERRLSYQPPDYVFKPKLPDHETASAVSSVSNADSVFERLYRREPRPRTWHDKRRRIGFDGGRSRTDSNDGMDSIATDKSVWHSDDDNAPIKEQKMLSVSPSPKPCQESATSAITKEPLSPTIMLEKHSTSQHKYYGEADRAVDQLGLMAESWNSPGRQWTFQRLLEEADQDLRPKREATPSESTLENTETKERQTKNDLDSSKLLLTSHPNAITTSGEKDEEEGLASTLPCQDPGAAMCVQRAWRRAVARSNYETFRTSAARIQAIARAKMARAVFARDKVMLIRAQAFAQACKRLEAIQAAVRLIQYNMRRFMARRTAARIRIQRNWRRHSTQSYYLLCKKSAICIQSVIRMNSARVKYLQRREVYRRAIREQAAAAAEKKLTAGILAEKLPSGAVNGKKINIRAEQPGKSSNKESKGKNKWWKWRSRKAAV